MAIAGNNNERAFSEFANSLPQIVFEIDKGGQFTFVNSSALEHFGYTVQDLKQGLNVLQVLSRDDHYRVKKNLAATFGGMLLNSSDYTALKKDGSTFPVRVFSSPINGGEGIIGVRGIAIDVTEQKKAEAALRRSEEKFSSLFLTMSEGVCLNKLIYNESGEAIDYVILDVNPAFELITGLKKESVVGQKASELFPVEPTDLQICASVAASGKPASFERYFAGIRRHYSISIFSPGKRKFATVFTDITARKETEARLATYQKSLRCLASQLSLAEERERRRIASEVHDRISQALAACSMKLLELAQSAPSEDYARHLQGLHTLIRQVADETPLVDF